MLNIHADLIWWTIITFVLLLLILRKVAWRPIIEALDARDEAMAKAKVEVENAQEEGRKRVDEHRHMLTKAEAEAGDILLQARDAADRVHKEITEQAKIDAEAIHERAIKEIEYAKGAALREVRDTITDLALTAAGRILGETLDEERHKRLIDDMIAELPQEPMP
jgi:F-type H+-transporting ATPase subunit b